MKPLDKLMEADLDEKEVFSEIRKIRDKLADAAISEWQTTEAQLARELEFSVCALNNVRKWDTREVKHPRYFPLKTLQKLQELEKERRAKVVQPTA